MLALLVRPVAGDRGVAARAGPCFEVILCDGMPVATDQEFVALRAVGVGGFGMDVAFVDEMEAGFASDLAGAVKGFGRGGRLVL